MRAVSAPLTNFYSSLDPTASEDPDGPDTTTHTHSQFSTHHCEAVSAVWFISQLQPEYLETSNPENPPLWQLSYLSHPEEEACTHRHTYARTENETPSVWQQQTNTQVVKSIMYAQQDAEVLIWCCAIFDVQHCWTHTCIWKWGHLFASAWKMSKPLMALKSASATVNCTGNKLGPKDKNCKWELCLAAQIMEVFVTFWVAPFKLEPLQPWIW